MPEITIRTTDGAQRIDATCVRGGWAIYPTNPSAAEAELYPYTIGSTVTGEFACCTTRSACLNIFNFLAERGIKTGDKFYVGVIDDPYLNAEFFAADLDDAVALRAELGAAFEEGVDFVTRQHRKEPGQ